MRSHPSAAGVRAALIALALAFCPPLLAQNAQDPDALLNQAEQLAWQKAWAKAEPLYAEAARLYEARGDRRNALYAEVNQLRGELPRLSVLDVSQRLAVYLDDPIVQTDDRLRLRCLVIKGETDEDIDPMLAQESWREAEAIAERINEPRWANRARGEIGFMSLLIGDLSSGVIQVTQALTEARQNGDDPSLVRWLTLFGASFTEIGRPQQAVDYFDQALKVAAGIPDLQFPVMTYLAKADALIQLQQYSQAEVLLNDALTAAQRVGSLGYEAEITLKRADMASRRGQTEQAIQLLGTAAGLAHQAGGNQILADIALSLASINRKLGRLDAAERALSEGVAAAREVGGHLMLSRMLAAYADLKSASHEYADAGQLLEEANDILEGVLTKTSSPWVRSRVIGSMDQVFLARLRLEAAVGRSPARAFTIVEEARGRSLLELLLATPFADVKKTPELRAKEREIASLQAQLLRATVRAKRQDLLDRIFVAEGELAPITTELFNRTRTRPRQTLTLRDVQQALRSDEVLLEFTLAEPDSYCIVVTRSTSRLQYLAGKNTLEKRITPLLAGVRVDGPAAAEIDDVSTQLLAAIPELAGHRRVIVSPDGPLHQLPFELLTSGGKRLLDTHVVSYTPSGSVLAILRKRGAEARPTRAALAISASPKESSGQANGSGAGSPTRDVPRGVYDLDLAKLPPLPSANDEARSVGQTLGATASTVLLGEAATELELKRQPLDQYRVLHFAVHGILSTKSPTRSALLLRPASPEDGLLQAWEILSFKLRAGLVTLSACDTGSGVSYGQEGVSSLVRPFLAAGAASVVANLWAADDHFSLTMMREFYRELAAGADVAEALRGAKLKMIQLFGPQAVPRLWSGVLAYGDTASVVAPVSHRAEAR
jgi:CHAT domain-containing protein/tetratricopeptide (TPR) repeat protein